MISVATAPHVPLWHFLAVLTMQRLRPELGGELTLGLRDREYHA